MISFPCNEGLQVFCKALYFYFYKQGRVKKVMPLLHSVKPLYVNFNSFFKIMPDSHGACNRLSQFCKAAECGKVAA